MHLGLNFNRIPKSYGSHGSVLAVFNLDAVVEDNPAVVPDRLANHLASFANASVSCGVEVFKLDTFQIVNVIVVTQMEEVARHPVEMPLGTNRCTL